MSNKVITVEGLAKAYRIGLKDEKSKTLGDAAMAWLKSPVKNYRRLKRLSGIDATASGEDIMWALNDISFDVERGDILGIIGKNGAGKSTLLKILSKITDPTKGNITVHGRVASLLEVGTGFNTDLTGRENTYLNGTILGMTRKEIDSKFDEIVDFSGVEKFIDTPVKRYSSGMKVRLGFAVAAHLDPEILILDEVLAVGDADFQKKCLGKMNSVVKNDGKTVLFVSHNMDAISMLCNKGLLLNKGGVSYHGDIEGAVGMYLNNYESLKTEKTFDINNAPGNDLAKILSVKVTSGNNSFYFDIADEILVEVTYLDLNPDQKNTAIIHLKDFKDNVIFASNEFNNEQWSQHHDGKPSVITARCHIPGNFLAEGRYSILAAVGSYSPNKVHVLLDDVVGFSVVESPDSVTVRNNTNAKWPGIVRPFLNWDIEKAPY